jgi:GH24 family phage-related lysozyme (muramidase)
MQTSKSIVVNLHKKYIAPPAKYWTNIGEGFCCNTLFHRFNETGRFKCCTVFNRWSNSIIFVTSGANFTLSFHDGRDAVTAKL